MSHQRTLRQFSRINEQLWGRYLGGHPCTLEISGKPDFHISSFYPLEYTEYGTLRNRSPRIAGRFVLARLIAVPAESGIGVVAGIKAEIGGYGFCLDMDDETHFGLVNQIPTELGLKNISFNRASAKPAIG